jgi:dipeptidase E
MTAILTSSPCIYGAPRAILNPENGFVDHLRRCLPERIRCLFVASSPDEPYLTQRFGYEMASCFAEAGFLFSDFQILDRQNQDDAQMLIWKSDLIILSGGHVPTQNAFFQDIGLKALLENYQGVILGISAGTMNAAKRVYVQPEDPGESVPEFQRFVEGLGLTNINVLPQYQMVKDNYLDGRRLFEDITYADSWGECFYVFVDGTYLLIEDGKTTLWGEAYCLSDGRMERICEAGEVIELED